MSLQADVHVRRGSLALDVTVDADAGETVVILGPNGAGKTTLLSVLAGLVSLDEGRVALGDLVLDDPESGTWVPTERRPIGYVFQEHLLFPHLSALDNVAFGLRAAGWRRCDARREALAWLERFGLGDHAAARPRALSGGQAQRVALARALARSPSLLLLDEPLAALDATTRIDVRRDLHRHLADFDGPRLVVTHDPIDVMALADRVIVLEQGTVMQTGTLADLRATPRSRYVADLVGINLYRGTLSGSRVSLRDGGQLVVVNDDQRRGDVFAVVRPDAVALHRDRPAGSPRNAWAAPVVTIDHEGPRARVTLGGAIPITAEITERSVAELGVTVGADAWVSVKATEIETYAA